MKCNRSFSNLKANKKKNIFIDWIWYGNFDLSLFFFLKLTYHCHHHDNYNIIKIKYLKRILNYVIRTFVFCCSLLISFTQRLHVSRSSRLGMIFLFCSQVFVNFFFFERKQSTLKYFLAPHCEYHRESDVSFLFIFHSFHISFSSFKK